MPTYTFRNKKTGEEYTRYLSLSDREKYLEENPDVEQLIVKPNGFVTGHNMKPDDGFRDILRNIKKNYPGSTIETF